MSRRVFITRQLKNDSFFKLQLEKAGFEVTGISLICFSPLPFSVVPDCDWIFFYSSNGVRFFMNRIKEENIPLPKRVKWATIGESTAKTLRSLGWDADFVGNGEPVATASQFKKISREQKVLFVRAMQSMKSVQNLLKDDLHILDFPVYNNEFKRNIEIPYYDWLVFTSPLNVKAYLSLRDITPKQEVVAIGSTTLKALKDMGIKRGTVSKGPSEKSMANHILSKASDNRRQH